MFNVAIDPPPILLLKWYNELPLPTRVSWMWGRGVCVHGFICLFALVALHACVCVCVFWAAVWVKSALSEGDDTHREAGTPCLKLSKHMPHPQFFQLFSQPPPFNLNQGLDRTASRHVWPPSYPLFLPLLASMLIYLCFIIIKSSISPLHLLLLLLVQRGSIRSYASSQHALTHLLCLCQQVTTGPRSAATSSAHVQCVDVCVLDCQAC